MIPNELKQRAIEAWKQYGDAMRQAFRWRDGYGLEMLSVEQAFATDDPENVKRFIKYCERAADEVQKLKFVGEPS